MLQVRPVARTQAALHPFSSNALASAAFEIVPIFSDPRLELTRLLREAANIEHALMLQYLFAAFSVKARYADELAGGPFDSSVTLMGVAVQEMHHFARVNELLVALRAQPNLDRQDFPIRTGIYPFPLELEPLTLTSVAKYVTAESPVGALDPATAPTEAERHFRESVSAALGTSAVNHIGSLYETVVARLRDSLAAHPDMLPDGGAGQLAILEQIRDQGEHDHFLFFRSVFEGSHPAFAGNVAVWSDPASDAYPSVIFRSNPTAFEQSPRTIPDPQSRRIAWLLNLHYWLVLGLLYLGHTATNVPLVGRAKAHMMACLLPLGRLLAARGVGTPFDALALNMGPGTDDESSRAWLVGLAQELQRHESEFDASTLPPDYSRSATSTTILALQGASQ